MRKKPSNPYNEFERDPYGIPQQRMWILPRRMIAREGGSSGVYFRVSHFWDTISPVVRCGGYVGHCHQSVNENFSRLRTGFKNGNSVVDCVVVSVEALVLPFLVLHFLDENLLTKIFSCGRFLDRTYENIKSLSVYKIPIFCKGQNVHIKNSERTLGVKHQWKHYGVTT